MTKPIILQSTPLTIEWWSTTFWSLWLAGIGALFTEPAEISVEQCYAQVDARDAAMREALR